MIQLNKNEMNFMLGPEKAYYKKNKNNRKISQ